MEVVKENSLSLCQARSALQPGWMDLTKYSAKAMNGYVMNQRLHCCHDSRVCPVTQPVRLSSCFARPAPVPAASGRVDSTRLLKCSAVAEDEVSTAEREDIDIENLDSKDFRVMFDGILEKTKTRFEVGDKVKGVVETCVSATTSNLWKSG